DHDGVAVGRRFYGEFHADIAAGAAAVVDDDLLTQALAELLAEHASLDVGRAPRHERYNETDGFNRVGLAVGGEARGNGGENREAADKRNHELPPLNFIVLGKQLLADS